MEIFLILILIYSILFGATALVGIISRVPYVPTKKRVMNKILDEANLKKGQTFIDLGCGDGRMLIEAEKRSDIKGIGYEIAPLVYLLALAKKLINKSKVKILFKSFFKGDLKKADVIFCYLMPHDLTRLANKIKKECKKGTRVISNTFKIQGLKLEKVIEKNDEEKTPTLYFYQI